MSAGKNHALQTFDDSVREVKVNLDRLSKIRKRLKKTPDVDMQWLVDRLREEWRV